MDSKDWFPLPGDVIAFHVTPLSDERASQPFFPQAQILLGSGKLAARYSVVSVPMFSQTEPRVVVRMLSPRPPKPRAFFESVNRRVRMGNPK